MINCVYSYLFLPIANSAIRIISIFNSKIKNRLNKCEELLQKYEQEPIYSNAKAKRYWFHAASMGEFEQAKPIIEKLKQVEPDCFVFVTFFSPSGYENQKNYQFADAIAYMPIDTKANANRLINIIKPNMAIFVRYEIWLNHLQILNSRQIPTILVNSSRPQSKLLDYYYRKAYNLFDKIFVMNENDSKYFVDIIKHKYVQVLADTRFDRIMERVLLNKDNPIFEEKLFGSNLVLVAGSTWSPDEDIILDAVNRINQESDKKISLVLVPHEPTEDHITNLVKKCNRSILLSEYLAAPDKYIEDISNPETIIIVDSIGKLLRLYANADIAYVGGAFGVGIHSVTEPAGYSLPIICGPKMQNSPDAIELKKLGSLISVDNSTELYKQLLRLISSQTERLHLAAIAGNYVSSRSGTTDKFLSKIK